jgi:hypothetical protein
MLITKNHHTTYNLVIEWETGEITSEPLQFITSDDPMSCALYSKEHNCLDQPRWKRFKNITKQEKSFTRIVNQAKLPFLKTSIKYKHGYEGPKPFNHDMFLDEKYGKNLWKDDMAMELQQIFDYQTFDGHLTEVPLDSLYYGDVIIKGFRLVIFLAEPNNLEQWATDIGNAYKESLALKMVGFYFGQD